MNRRPPTLPVDSRKIAASLISITLVVAILFWAKVVLIPLALGVLVTFVLAPLVTRVERWGLHRIPAVLIVVATAGLILSGLFVLVGSQLHSLANDLPNYRENLREKLAMVREGSQGGVVDKLRSTLDGALQDTEQETPSDPAADSPDDVGVVASEQTPLPVRIMAAEGPEQTLENLFASLTALAPALEVLATGGFALILVIFMLIRREDLRNRLVSFASGGSLTTTTKALDDAGRRISRYLLMQLIINGSFGVAVAVGLALIGVPYAFLWGLCAAVLRYIPYLGPWIAAILPLTVSLITSPGWTQVLLVFGLFMVLELISNNVMEPYLYGQGIGISEVALLVSAAFWTWIWGPVGLVLATPLAVCLAVAGKYVPSLYFLDRLLGDRPALAPHAALLQRLVARDSQEATRIVHNYCQENSRETVYDEVLIPALSMVRTERDRGTMMASEEKAILEVTRGILADVSQKSARSAAAAEEESVERESYRQRLPQVGRALINAWHMHSPLAGRNGRSAAAASTADNSDVTPATNPQPKLPPAPPRSQPTPAVVPTIRVLGCPSHKEVEELTLQMLDQLAETKQIAVDVLSTRTLPSEVVQRVRRDKPTAVVIGVLPPGGMTQAHYLCKLLRKKFPNLGIVVGCWGYDGDLDRSIMKFRAAGAHYVTTTLLGARDHVESFLATPSSPASESPEPVASQHTAELAVGEGTSL